MNAPNNIELRDWFAGMALQSIAGVTIKDGAKNDHDPEWVIETIALSSYKIADAMLAARKPAVDEPEWIPWRGGECPVDGKCIVTVKLEDGTIGSNEADSFIWSHDSYNDNIIAYRIGGGK